MKQPRWVGTSLAAVVVAGGLLFACGGDDNDDEFESPLLPGGSTITGDIDVANTNGDTSLAGFTVEAESDRAVTTTTDANGGFTLADSPTGNVLVTFTRGACSASFVLGNVISRSTLDLDGITIACGSATVASIAETFRGVIHEDPPSPATPIDTCVRVGDDNQFRDIDGSTAVVTDEFGDTATFELFADENLIEATGNRPAVGEAGVLDASAIRIIEGDVDDPCELG